MHSVISFNLRPKRGEEPETDGGLAGLSFSERMCTFSLDFLTVGPPVFDGARRKVVLRDEDFTWVSVLRSFDKLREVGVLSYLSYTLFKCFVDD